MFLFSLFFASSIASASGVYRASLATSTKTPLPVVLWHGMGDGCCFSFSMGWYKKVIEKAVPGIEVISIEIGESETQDIYHSFFMDVNQQVEMVCQQLSHNKKIAAAGGYNAIGYSQGGQFLRAVAQRCPKPRMNNLITIGAQHQGVFGLPKCNGVEQRYCDYARIMLDMGAYLPFVQKTLVQAQYWHDPFDEEAYAQFSMFLSDINQEKTFKQSYKDNFLKIKHFVMVKFLRDTMVQPIESEWFGFYNPGQDVSVYNYTQSPLYTEDKLGLRTMEKEGRLHFFKVNDDHLRMPDTFFVKQIVRNFLV